MTFRGTYYQMKQPFKVRVLAGGGRCNGGGGPSLKAAPLPTRGVCLCVFASNVSTDSPISFVSQDVVRTNVYPVPSGGGIPVGVHFTPTVNERRGHQMIVGPGAFVCV